jgi:signal transduction histidine kinase
MLRELDAELQPAAEAKGLALRAEVPEGDVCALGESTQLRRLFLILIDNAIKYTEQGSVRVGLGHEGGEVVVRVVDTGIGIEKDAVGHVFDRFWRADKVRSRAEGGAGLRLSLAAQIVQRHGGTISVGSEVGKGSEFMVRLKGSERGAA